MQLEYKKQEADDFHIQYAMRSRIGNRQRNEDHIKMAQKGKEFFFALADGLGGHGKGDEASEIAVEQACRVFCQTQPHTLCLEDAFDSAQRRLLSEKTRRGLFSAMDTTMVLLQLDHETSYWAHMGDSRLYVFQNGKIQTRTKDHSVPQVLVSNGEINESEIRHHPDRSHVLRVLGEDMEQCVCDVSEEFFQDESTRFLLCTDGFWELIEECDMESTLDEALSPAQWLDSMEYIILQNGANLNMDNYSAIAVWVTEA